MCGYLDIFAKFTSPTSWYLEEKLKELFLNVIMLKKFKEKNDIKKLLIILSNNKIIKKQSYYAIRILMSKNRLLAVYVFTSNRI